MTPTRPLHRALAAGALALATGLAPAVPAAAATAGPQVVVTGEGGQAVAAPDAATVVQLAGTGFQSVAGGFGGIYVLFGWVDEAAGDGWRPSAGGASGVQYRYAVDEQSQENAGHQRFVAFPGGSTAVEANGGEVAADGTWATELTIPGATLTALGPDGGTDEVDCRQVTCGVITIGAHGVANANNESFTPVAFAPEAGPESEPVAATDEPSAAPAEATATPVAAPAEPEDAGTSGMPAVWVAFTAVGVLAAGTTAVVALRRQRAAQAGATDQQD